MRLYRSFPRYIYAKKKKELFRIQTHQAHLERAHRFNRTVRARLANDPLRLADYSMVCRLHQQDQITDQEFFVLVIAVVRFEQDLLQSFKRLISRHSITIGPESVTFIHQSGVSVEITTRRSHSCVQTVMLEHYRQRNHAPLRRR